MREGLDDAKTWEAILSVYIESGEEQVFMKMLNTAINFVGEDNLTCGKKLAKLVTL